MNRILPKFIGQGSAKVWPLYGAAFAMSIGLSALWTAMPFIVRNIGGTEQDVGYVWAANMLGYLVCLLFAAWMLGHLAPRRTTRAAAAVMLLATVVMAVVVYRVVAFDQPGRDMRIWMMIGAGTLAGAAMSLFWPFLMTWVSADYEGPILNRRLGAYNGTWSSAAIVGPVMGGALVDMNTLGPIVAGITSLAICFALLCLAHDGSAGVAASVERVDGPETCFDRAALLRFKWMARISLFCSWVCLGVSRSQFALLFTSLGFSETQFGMLVTLFGVCNFLVLTCAGRFGLWHFKALPLFGLQAFLGLSLLLLIHSRTLWAFIPAFVIMGVAFGFAYSSHLYYGACGSKKRSTPMAIHEATISLGVIIGSGFGGYLSGHYGTYSPYWFAIIVLALGLLTQLAVYLWAGPRRDARPA